MDPPGDRESSARGKARIRVWKERGRAFPVTLPNALRQKLDYMHQNPVRSGLVEQAQDWEFSSASWYQNGIGLLRIDQIDWHPQTCFGTKSVTEA